MGFFRDVMGEGAEQEIFRKSGAIIKHAIAANKALARIAREERSSRASVKAIERDADTEVFELVTEITSGGIAPNLIDDLMQFIDLEDDIVDNMFALSMALSRYRITDKKTREYAKKSLLKTCELIGKSLDLLIKMHNAETIAEMRRLRAQIEKYEQEDDEIKEGLLDFAYNTKMNYKDFYQLTNVAYLSDDVMDGCEDSSDMLLSIMQSILT